MLAEGFGQLQGWKHSGARSPEKAGFTSDKGKTAFETSNTLQNQNVKSVYSAE